MAIYVSINPHTGQPIVTDYIFNCDKEIVMKDYYTIAPRGAITDLGTFVNLEVGTTFYRVSKAHSDKVSNLNTYTWTGEYGINNDKNHAYHWFKLKDTNGNVRTTSTLDANLLPQTYNDWYIFTDKNLARRYLGETVDLTTDELDAFRDNVLEVMDKVAQDLFGVLGAKDSDLPELFKVIDRMAQAAKNRSVK